MLIREADVVTPEGVISGKTVTVKNGKISKIGAPATDIDEVIEAKGCSVYPGFIDLHVHGGDGAEAMDGTIESVEKMCRFHGRAGTTSFLLTTSTLPDERLMNFLNWVRHFHDEPVDGSQVLGVHLEGPVLSEEFRGAQNVKYLQHPSLSKMKEWVESSGSKIKLVSLAPELPGAEEVIRYLVEQGIVVSAAHTGATYEEMTKAMDWGVTHATHCFNGMRPFHHRDPGLLAAILMDERVCAELIFDTNHVHPAAAKVLIQNKGVDRVSLITDAVRPAGMPDGEYGSVSEKRVTVKNGRITTDAGGLAGSTLTMNRAVQNAINFLNVAPEEAAQMASLTPASVLGLQRSKGSVEVGKDADLVILNSDYDVQYTISKGKIIYQN